MLAVRLDRNGSWPTAPPVAIAGSLDDHSRYLPALRAGPAQGTGELVWSVMLAGITECGIPAMSLADNGIVYTGRLRAFECCVRGQPARPGHAHHQLRPVSPADLRQDRTVLADAEEMAARPPDPGHPRRTQRLCSTEFRDFYNHQRPHRALRGATPAETFSATEPSPARRPPATCTGIRQPPHRRSKSQASCIVPPYRVNVGLRWAGHKCDVIRDGDHIAIFSGTTLVREFTADPTRRYQRSDKTTRTYRTREPKPRTMSVSDVPRHNCQRCPETPHRGDRG